VTFSLSLPLSISSCAVWASAQLHQEDNSTASIFFIAPSLSGISERQIEPAQCLLRQALDRRLRGY
jgi:hypothetical protein